MVKLHIEATSVSDPRAAPLIRALSETLGTITGSTGEASFSASDLDGPGSIFLLAQTDGIAKGCGALRKVDLDTCEIKRMYAAGRRIGIGSFLLVELERRAAELGYRRIILETRRVNVAAVTFYLKHAYSVIPNYGRYVGNPLAICFSKAIKPNEPPDPMG
jgi:GNAT superfamily N-acetyltransferase